MFLNIKSFLLIYLLSVSLAVHSKPPQLILSIIVDEIDNDELLLLQSSFSDKGFNRLAREGFRFMSAVSHDLAGYPGTRIASIYSGMNPNEHGIVGEQWYNYTSEQFSQKVSFDNLNSLLEIRTNIVTRTLGDFVKGFYGPNSKVAAISINSPWMTHTLGYYPDYFFTLSPQNGFFYDALNNKEFGWVNEFNSRYSLVDYLSKQWGPKNDITSYVEFRYSSDEQRSNFRKFLYDIDAGGKYSKVVASPYGNTMLRDFIIAFLVNSRFGQDDIPDLLSVCFTTRHFSNNNGTILPAEKEDMLLRLDIEIASIIDFLDYEFGRKNYLIMFTSAKSPPPNQSSFGKQGITTGYFDSGNSMSLLNLYLMAVYGQEKWVLGYSDGMIFLNRKVIEQKGMSLKNMQEEVALFMHDVSGVAKAMPLFDYMLNTHCDDIFSKNLFPKKMGDVFLTFLPGWQTTETQLGSRQDGNSGFQSVPFIFFGWNTNKGAWFDNIETTDLIPLLLKNLELTHPKIYRTDNVPAFVNPAEN
ncbi:MAG: alkaline phosphatase family protein [Marinilabiliaceae bacterium]|nr:alkaline phosphatase family protein [Marinilabiliaceae bacterium]